MNRLTHGQIAHFQRAYRFPGSALRRVRVVHRGSKDVAIEFTLSVRKMVKDLGAEPPRVRLTLRLDGVEEFRLQMRPGQSRVKVADARIAYLNGLYYVNFDSLGLEPNEQPKVFDFRASEAFAAGRELLWEETPAK